MLYNELRESEVHIPEGIKKIYEGIVKEGRSLVINDISCDSPLVPIGSLYIDKANQKFSVKKAAGRSSVLPTDIFDDLAITDQVIAKNGVDANRLKPRTIYASRIAYNTISDPELINRGISGSKLKENSIESNHIKEDAILSKHLSSYSVTTDAIASSVIIERHIQSYSISDVHIKDQAIVSDHIFPNAILSAHIGNYVIQTRHLKDYCIQPNHLSSLSVQEKHLKDESVTGNKIRDKSIQINHFSQNCISSYAIADNQILARHIKANEITSVHLSDSLWQMVSNALKVIGDVATVLNLVVTKKISTTDLVATTLNADTCNLKKDLNVTGNISVGGDVNVTGKVHHAVYNDLAEAYVPGEKLNIGDCVALREDGKVYKAQAGECYVGVISEDYADCYGASIYELLTGEKIAVGLIGKVPVKIKGTGFLGDYIALSNNGYAIITTQKENAIGKLLENKTLKTNTAMCLIFPC